MNFPDAAHLQQLQKDLWSWPRSRAAVMVGAGLSLNSIPLPGVTSRFPTWKQLVRSMFNELHPPQPNETAEQIRRREDRFNSSNALRLASEYESAFDRRKLELLIRTQNPDTEHQPGPLHTLLLRLPWTDVFTTNYDTLLERTDVPGRTYQVVTKPAELTTAFAPRIVKLHGSFPSETPFIISEEDYRTYPKKFAPFVNSVQQSLLENSFMLIGFSGDDPNFLEWTGWIRDELGGNHAPIYLVGPLSLGNGERALLARRGVTPIDLAPAFAGIVPVGGLHAASLEWFLNCLASARPPRPERWPNFETGSAGAEKHLPIILRNKEEPPPSVGITPNPGKPLTEEELAKCVTRWRFERQKFPGWIVAPEEKRSRIWEATKYWITPMTEISKNWPPMDRVLLFREMNWRLETAMVPLFSDWIQSFEKATNDLFESLKGGEPPRPTIPWMAAPNVSNAELVEAWIQITFGMLRESREMYNAIHWRQLKDKLDVVVARYPQYLDRNYYEAALWEIWNVNRAAAKAAMLSWIPSSRAPVAAMWKAGLLAELDELGEAQTLLRAALTEIRRALRNQGKNIELLSLEGWCTYLLFSVETANDFKRHQAVREEFSERWHELKEWDCNPWLLKEYFNDVLASAPPKAKTAEEKNRGFDPGHVSLTLHFDGDQITPYLAGFAAIRLYEQVGVPVRLKMVNIGGDSLAQACRWIAPFIGFWSPALLIRAGKLNDLTKNNFLTRTQVAAMPPEQARKLYDWCLEIFERELSSLTGPIEMGSAQESLLEILPQVLSRLAFKVEPPKLERTFPLVLQFNKNPQIRSHIRLHESSEPWFCRMFDAADSNHLLKWLPELIRAPLFDEYSHPVLPESHTCPDPMQRFPTGRRLRGSENDPELIGKVSEATDWLIRRARSESGEARRRALNRLIYVHHAGIMSDDQKQELGELLWEKRGTNGLPDRPDFAAYGFFHLPAPKDVNVVAAVKDYLLQMPVVCSITCDQNGRISLEGRWREQPFITEVAFASKPVVQLAGESLGCIEWTAFESIALYRKARAWWASDKEAFNIAKSEQPFGTFRAEPVVLTIERLGSFLARAVIPNMNEAAGQDWDDLFCWLREMHSFGFPTVAWPYVLLKQPQKASEVESILQEDIGSRNDSAVAQAATAIRHWANLHRAAKAPLLPTNLLSGFVKRVLFRQREGIATCLVELTYLVTEQSQIFERPQIDLLTASLEPWYYATAIPATGENGGDFHEIERPDLRAAVASLAGALSLWYKRKSEGEPPLIGLWRDSCAIDPLPEIRKAFDLAATIMQ